MFIINWKKYWFAILTNIIIIILKPCSIVLLFHNKSDVSHRKLFSKKDFTNFISGLQLSPYHTHTKTQAKSKNNAPRLTQKKIFFTVTTINRKRQILKDKYLTLTGGNNYTSLFLRNSMRTFFNIGKLYICVLWIYFDKH